MSISQAPVRAPAPTSAGSKSRDAPSGPKGRDGRVERAFAEARRHSGRVRLLKVALPAAALLMIAGFAAKSWLSAPTGLPIDLRALAIEDGRLVMTDPRLDGLTGRDGRPYSMTATRAVQDLGMSARIDLEGIDARLPVDDRGWMNVSAPSGVFDREANRLDIDSELTIVGDDGLRAVFQSAVVDMTSGSLETADPVDITLQGAHITADSMTIRDRGAVLTFDNRVRMQIEGGRLKGGAEGGEAR